MVYFTGASFSTDFPYKIVTDSYNQGSNQGNSDAFILEFTEEGEYLHGTLFGGDGWDYGHSVATNIDGSDILFCGPTAVVTTPILPFPFRDPGNAYFWNTAQWLDAYIVNLVTSCNPCLRITEEDFDSYNPYSNSIYPNPSNEYVQIHYETEIRNVSIFNSLGMLIRLAGNNSKVFVGDLPKGLYLIKYQDKTSKTMSSRIIIN